MTKDARVYLGSPELAVVATLPTIVGVDVIEVGYPGAFHKDYDEIVMVSQQVKHSISAWLPQCLAKNFLIMLGCATKMYLKVCKI